jgi:hypothetical protein
MFSKKIEKISIINSSTDNVLLENIVFVKIAFKYCVNKGLINIKLLF